MSKKPNKEKLLENVSLACDGHSMGDIMHVMSAIMASMIEDLEIEKGIPIALSVSMMAIQSAYDIEAEAVKMSEYLQ